MEAAVRHLRDGALTDAATCATCCVFDDLGVIGGGLILRHATQSFISAMLQGRSQSSSVRLVDITGALTDIATSASVQRQLPGPSQKQEPPGPNVELIDLCSDPWGWQQAVSLSNQPASETCAGPGPRVSASGLVVSLDALRTALLRPQPQPLQQLQQDRSGGAASAAPPPGTGNCTVSAAAAAAAITEDRLNNNGGAAGPPAAVGCRSVCVVIDCLSTLMERYGEWQALCLLEAVQRSPVVSCVLTSLHTDLHPERVTFAVRRLASCSLELSPLTELQTEVALRTLGATGAGRASALAGRLDCRTKRRTGRVKVESELYSLSFSPATLGNANRSTAVPSSATTPLAFHPVPPVLDAPDPKTLVRLKPPAAATSAEVAEAAAGAATRGPGGRAEAPAAVAAAPGGSGGGAAQPVGLLSGVTSAEELARAVGSSMRLTLTEEERRAKQQVVLPYQHQGQQHRGSLGAAYAAGDHTGYLPPAAGGTGPAAGGAGQQALGHILYVRDSASEADSDQELDEDLDI